MLWSGNKLVPPQLGVLRDGWLIGSGLAYCDGEDWRTIIWAHRVARLFGGFPLKLKPGCPAIPWHGFTCKAIQPPLGNPFCHGLVQTCPQKRDEKGLLTKPVGLCRTFTRPFPQWRRHARWLLQRPAYRGEVVDWCMWKISMKHQGPFLGFGVDMG